jgi:hypothetical protein
MPAYEGNIKILQEIGGPPIEVVQRGYELKVDNSRPGERVFTALGQYAIHRPHAAEQWEFLPGGEWRGGEILQDGQTVIDWATAEELRTRAGENTFLPEHMDLLDATLFHEQRVTSPATRLAIATEAELHTLLADHSIPTNQWNASVGRLFRDISRSESSEETENISLHLVDGDLWLSTAQTMVNVYHKDKAGALYKLKETDISYFDEQGNVRRRITSKQRSSLGETGHIIHGRPERPFVAARRALYEELGCKELGFSKEDDIAAIVSTGSLLRLKDRHHAFGAMEADESIKAEDHTHYFDAHLYPFAIRPEGYTNKEYDQGHLRAESTLEWRRLGDD